MKISNQTIFLEAGKSMLKILQIPCLVFFSLSAQAENITYFHNDALGSPIAATNDSGSLEWQRTYKPFGEVNSGETNNAIGYTGHAEDADTGLTYMQARYYNPTYGRFLATDPVRFTEENMHSFNRYAYANNNPYLYFDPNGRWSAKAHDKLIAYSFSGKLSKSEISILQKASRDFDKRTQAANQSHMHSMAQKGQNSSDAIKMRDAFINNTLQKAGDLASAGNRDAALKLLGESLHPIMDSSSPMHTDSNGNPKQWDPLHPWGHSPADFIGKETSKDLNSNILENQKIKLNAAYEKVFKAGASKAKQN